MTRIPWFLVIPSIVLAELTIGYALVPWACARQTSVPLHALMAVTLGAVAVATMVSWRDWRIERTAAMMNSSDTVEGSRAEFIAMMDTLVCVIAGLVVVAQWVSVFLLSPCH